MDEDLVEGLRRVQKPAISLPLADGSEALVLPYGGRVLGLFPRDESLNFLWTNPALSAGDSAQALVGSERWQNLGGDRTWLGPEVEYFFPRYPDYGAYLPPRCLDAVDYAAEPTQGGLSLTTRFAIQAYRTGVTVPVRITKTISSAVNPLPNWGAADGVRFAGFTLHSTLERGAGAGDAAPLGLWTLCQLPHGGELLISTTGLTEPTVFFGQVPPPDLRSSPKGVLYRMRTPGEHKIGIGAGAASGRMGYLVRRGREADLVIRTFEVNPRGDYVDGPPTRPEDRGYAVEACNVSNPDLGDFAEMEYHAPAVGRPGRIGHDISRIWAYRGPVASLEKVANALLGQGFSP